MENLFYCHPTCTTCKKARIFLQERGIPFLERNLQKEHPTAAELSLWHRQSGLPLRRFFNTSGLQYRAQNLSERLPAMTDEEMLALLASDGMLVKRPLFLAGNAVLVGFREAEWQALAENRQG